MKVERTSTGIKIDFRRCKRCGKIPRGKFSKSEAERYAPFCSYQCQQFYGLEEAQRYINSRRRG